MTHWPVKLSNNTNHMSHYLLRKHHWLRNIHLPQGCAGACGLCGAVAHRLGVWRRDLCSGFHVLRWAGCHHSQVWRRLFIRDGDLWRPCGVNSGLVHIVISRYLIWKLSESRLSLCTRRLDSCSAYWNQSALKISRQSCDRSEACKCQTWPLLQQPAGRPTWLSFK